MFYRFFVKGVVQGVGFRPYIYRKAKSLGLKGFVRNTGSGVEIVVDYKEFINELDDLPPLARVYECETRTFNEKKDFDDFSILKSESDNGETSLPPDIFTCKDCLNELKDPKDRRNNYYFITCTNCGPRFSMIKDYPYDRHTTSMDSFKMCSQCEKEYTEPMNRRYHAQTIACKDCGPKLRLVHEGKEIGLGSDLEKVKRASEIIKRGELLAIKGVGGFHLSSLCDDKIAEKMRKKKIGRVHKPFAIMVKNVESAKRIVFVSDAEESLLKSVERPIVILRKKINDSLNKVSELDSVGVMLPYTALHHMLFEFIGTHTPLVMTSCNSQDEPVALTEDDTRSFLTHEREIVNRCDDSVMKIIDGKPLFLRRSRGFVPLPINLPIGCKDTIALGAELNNVVCAAKGRNAFLSQYIGNTANIETFKFMKQAAQKIIKLTRLRPKIIACDLHPGYNSTAYAEELSKELKAKIIRIQHHKAHVASVAAEHGIKDYVGIAMDGLGYGDDGNIWGGEVFKVTDGINFDRIGSLEEQPQLGGDAATLHPNKMLFGILSKFMDEKELAKTGLYNNKKEIHTYARMLKENFNVATTTSAGRILDAAAALLGFCDERTYDGRPAMILESKAKAAISFKLDPILQKKDGRLTLSTTELFRFMHLKMIASSKSESGLAKTKTKARIAATAQTYLAKGLLEIAREKSKGLPVVFSGGVAYNRMISRLMIKKGVLLNKQLPPGDGGVCYGQAYLANLMGER